MATNSPRHTFTSFRFETPQCLAGMTRIKLCSMPSMRTELSDGTITIRAYEPGIELAVFEAARESVPEVGPWMRTWRGGATYAIAAPHVAQALPTWHTRTGDDFPIPPPDPP